MLSRALEKARDLISTGETRADGIKHESLRVLNEHPEIRVEYLEIVGPEDMQPVDEITGPVRVAGAIWIGKTRLIDNILCVPGAGG